MVEYTKAIALEFIKQILAFLSGCQSKYKDAFKNGEQMFINQVITWKYQYSLLYTYIAFKLLSIVTHSPHSSFLKEKINFVAKLDKENEVCKAEKKIKQHA